MNKRIKILLYRYGMFLRPLSPLNRLRIICRWIRQAIPESNRPQSLEIGVTYRCQLNCVHCGIFGCKQEDGTELSLERIKGAIAQARKLGVYLVILSGGEPLLRKDTLDLIEYTTGTAMMCAVSTNGLLIDKSTAKKLKQARLSFINISLDSTKATIHDKLRGKTGAFTRATEAINTCVNAGISTIISTYATKENIENGELETIIALAKKLGASGVRILLAVPAGRWLGNQRIFLSEEDKQRVRALLDPTYVYIEGVCNKFTECKALLKKLFYISPDGLVQPCNFIPVYFGDIRREPLERIWRKIRTHTFYDCLDASDCAMRNPRLYRRYPEILKNGGRLLRI